MLADKIPLDDMIRTDDIGTFINEKCHIVTHRACDVRGSVAMVTVRKTVCIDMTRSCILLIRNDYEFLVSIRLI